MKITATGIFRVLGFPIRLPTGILWLLIVVVSALFGPPHVDFAGEFQETLDFVLGK
jgi:hypothetical protein